MICTHCQFENSKQAKFCSNCGQPLSFILEAAPSKPKFSSAKVIVAFLLLFLGLRIIVFISNWPLNHSIQSNSYPATDTAFTPTTATTPPPSPSPMPELSSNDHLAEAKTLIGRSYDKENYELAMKHLSVIPEKAREYREAGRLLKQAGQTFLYEEAAGPIPARRNYDGKVYCVDYYLKRVLNDYDSAEYLEWRGPAKIKKKGITYWTVQLTLRAKNGFGAKVIKAYTFLIQNNQVVKASS